MVPSNRKNLTNQHQRSRKFKQKRAEAQPKKCHESESFGHPFFFTYGFVLKVLSITPISPKFSWPKVNGRF